MMNAYDAMLRAGGSSMPSPQAQPVGNAEGAEAYKQRAIEYNNRLRGLREKHSGSSYIHPDVASEARRLRHERDSAINQWQELEARGHADSDRTQHYEDDVSTVPPTDELFSDRAPKPATDIVGKLGNRAKGIK